PRHRGDPRIGDPAGDHVREPAQVIADVESDPVLGHPTRQLDPDGGQLVRADPGAGVAGPADGDDAVAPGGGDERALQRPEVGDHVPPPWSAGDGEDIGEPDDRVGDQLAGAVEGDRAAPVDLDAVRSEFAEGRGASSQMAVLSISAHRVDGGVREEEDAVVDPPRGPGGGQPPLQLPGLLVGDGSQPEPAQGSGDLRHRMRRAFGPSPRRATGETPTAGQTAAAATTWPAAGSLEGT